MAKDAYYFTHDANARNDTKIILLRSKYGFEGYGRYWAVIEMMREADGYKLPVDEFLFPGLALSLSMAEKDAKAFISDCVRLLLFIMDDFLYSESLSERMEKLRELQRKKSEAGKKGADKRWQNHGSAIAVPKQGNSKPIASIHLSTHSSIQSSKKEKTLARPRNEDAPKESFEDFNTWWKAYPKKVGRGAAVKIWKKQVRGNVELSKMLSILEKQKASDQWQKEGGQYIPNPATYLNQGRWDDEVSGGGPVTGGADIIGSIPGMDLEKKYGGHK